MLNKIIAGFLILATTTVYGMSLSQVNSASKAELMEINGIGEAKASAIIKERKKGKFKSFDDFERVEGIGAQTASNVKNNVKSSANVKKVKKTTKKKTTTTKKADKKTNKTKSKTKSKTETKEKKKRKIKSIDEKKKELKTKPKKTKKTKTKKEKKTKSKN